MITTVQTPLRVEYVPHPRDYVQIKGTLPYTVPPGKLFVLTGLGTPAGFTSCTMEATALKVNTVVELRAGVSYCGSAANLSTVAPVPVGFMARAGDIVEPVGPTVGSGRAWGYVVDQ